MCVSGERVEHESWERMVNAVGKEQSVKVGKELSMRMKEKGA